MEKDLSEIEKAEAVQKDLPVTPKGPSRKRSLASLLLSSPRSPDREAYYQDRIALECQKKTGKEREKKKDSERPSLPGETQPPTARPHPPQKKKNFFFVFSFVPLWHSETSFFSGAGG